MSVDIYHGDCMSLMKELPDNSVDLIITDPPYNIETKHGAGIYKQDSKRYIKSLEGMCDGFSPEVLDELCRVLKKINIYFFCSQKQILPLLEYFHNQKGCNWNLITWHKTNPVPACCNKYLTDTEYVLFFRDKGVPIYGDYDTKRTWYTTPLNKADKNKYGHPTVKPLGIVQNFVVNSSLEGDLVLDPFTGSGTTGVACANTGRNFIGYEINPQYFEVAQKRIRSTLIDKSLPQEIVEA